MFSFLKHHKNGILGTLLFHFVLLNIFFILKLSSSQELESSNIYIEFENYNINYEKEVKKAIDKEVILSEKIDYTNYAYKINQLKGLEEKLYGENNEAHNNGVTEEYIENVIKNAIGEELFEQTFNKEKAEEIKTNNKEKIQGEKIEENKHLVYKGPSTLIYEIENRAAIHLPLPVYKCQGGGVIKLIIEVNRQGAVISAIIDEYNENNADNCILQTALTSALSSKFNTDYNAPEIQKGTIIYTFVSQ